MPLSDGTLTHCALLCAARHFGVPANAIVGSTVTVLGKRAPALLTFAAPFIGDQGQLRLVCVLLLRRELKDWTFKRGVDEAISWQDRESFGEWECDRRALELAVETLRELLRRTPVAALLAGPSFGLADIRAIYDDLWGGMDAPNFQRRFTAPEAGLLEEFTTSTCKSKARRPTFPRPS